MDYEEIWPIPVDNLINFGGFLKQKGMAMHFIKGEFLALAFASKILGFIDRSGDFRVRKMSESWSQDAGPSWGTKQLISLKFGGGGAVHFPI